MAKRNRPLEACGAKKAKAAACSANGGTKKNKAAACSASAEVMAAACSNGSTGDAVAADFFPIWL